MKQILSLKHWQLFLLIVITGAWTSPSPLKEVINSISILTFTVWIYTIGHYGEKEIQELNLSPMNDFFFKINISAIPIFIVLLYTFSFNNTIENSQFLTVIFSILGLCLFFAIFYCLIFVSKILTKIELKREVAFPDYFANFLLMLLPIIGIWFIQPKVNKLLGHVSD